MVKIVIVSTNAIGDSYISCSAIDTLNNKIGNINTELITLYDSKCFVDSLNVNKAYYIKKRSFDCFLRLKKELKDKHYDYAFSFFPGRFNSIVINLLESKYKYYYKNYIKIVDWHNTCQYLWVNGKKSNIYWNNNMNFLDRVNIPLGLLFQNKVSVKKPIFNFKVPNKIVSSPQIVINYQSRDIRKRLSIRILNSIIDFLENDLNLSVCVINFDEHTNKDLRSKNILPNVKNFPILVNNILNSDLFITVDSFLLHVADAYRIKMLGLFNITNPNSVYDKQNVSSLHIDYNDINNLPFIKSEIVKLLNNSDKN